MFHLNEIAWLNDRVTIDKCWKYDAVMYNWKIILKGLHVDKMASSWFQPFMYAYTFKCTYLCSKVKKA
jgi:hypothetical protein